MDMAGNVWEWCLNTLKEPTHSRSCAIDDPISRRVLRGGSWFKCDPGELRCAYRFDSDPGYLEDDVGFRCAQDAP